jgi:hypothetical protein
MAGRRNSKNRLARFVAGAIIALGIGGAAMKWTAGVRQARQPIVLNPTTRQTPPATLPVQIVSATKPTDGGGGSSTTRAVKATSQMQINNVLVLFPEAKLTLRREGDKVSAFLVSNDPPEVIQPTFQGNRYYFEMTLDSIDDVKDIASADFRYKAGSASAPDKQETQNGIFLDGDRQHLEPYDILVTFDREGEYVIANIQGQFIFYPKGSVAGQWVPVIAQLAAKPEVSEKK